MPLNLIPRRAPLVLASAAFVAVALGACGRRGPLEPPVDPSAAPTPPAAAPAPAGSSQRRAAPADPRLRPGAARVSQPNRSAASLAADPLGGVVDSPDTDDDDEVTDTVAPIPTARRRTRAYVVPTEPFILDPLL